MAIFFFTGFIDRIKNSFIFWMIVNGWSCLETRFSENFTVQCIPYKKTNNIPNLNHNTKYKPNPNPNGNINPNTDTNSNPFANITYNCTPNLNPNSNPIPNPNSITLILP